MDSSCAESGPGLGQLSRFHWRGWSCDLQQISIYKISESPLHNLAPAVVGLAAGWDNRRDKEWWKGFFSPKRGKRSLVRRAGHGLVHLCSKDQWLQTQSNTCHSGPLVLLPNFGVRFPGLPSCLMGRESVTKCTGMSSLSLCSMEILPWRPGWLPGFLGHLFHPQPSKGQCCHVPVMPGTEARQS